MAPHRPTGGRLTALIEEVSVLIETTAWLEGQGWRVVAVKAPSRANVRRVEAALKDRGKSVAHIAVSTGEGPDVLARKEGMEWTIECKGMGERSNTRWSDFHRGLGEVVSHYSGGDGQRLGFALPDCPDFRRFAAKMTHQMRSALSLWVLLCDIREASVVPVSPDEILCPFCAGETVFGAGDVGHLAEAHREVAKLMIRAGRQEESDG